MWENVDLTWQSNSILFNATCARNHTAPATVDLECETKILNHEHASSLPLLET